MASISTNMLFSFSHKKRIFKIKAMEMRGLERGIGLMFSTSQTRSRLFRFESSARVSITSFFVFFPFLAIWLDEDRKVMEYCVVDPFTFSLKPKKKAYFLLEVPLNEKKMKIFRDFLK